MRLLLVCFSLCTNVFLAQGQTFVLDFKGEPEKIDLRWLNPSNSDELQLDILDQDFSGNYQSVTVLLNGQHQFLFKRKGENRILRTTEEDLALLYRPFQYTLPNGQQMIRKLKNGGKKILLQNQEGNYIASGQMVCAENKRSILQVAMLKSNFFDQAILAMLAIDLLEQWQLTQQAISIHPESAGDY